MISIAIPVHDMEDKDYFLKRCLDSIEIQTYKDYEIVITEDGTMAENTNSAIKKSKGDIIKILYMDDFFNHENALKNIVDNFKGQWLVTGCTHTHSKDRFNEHYPSMNENIHKINTIGSPSVMTIKNNNPLLFDENMTWLLDCDYYKRMYEKYGEPVLLNDINVVIGVGEHQMTRKLDDTLKNNELMYVKTKHETN